SSVACEETVLRACLRIAASSAGRDTLGGTCSTSSRATKRVSSRGGTPVKPRSPGSGRCGRRSHAARISPRCATTKRRRSSGPLPMPLGPFGPLAVPVTGFAPVLSAACPVGPLAVVGPVGPLLKLVLPNGPLLSGPLGVCLIALLLPTSGPDAGVPFWPAGGL